MKRKNTKALLAILLSIIIGYSANKVQKEDRITKILQMLENSDNITTTIMDEYFEALNHSYFSNREKKILLKEFVPYLTTHADELKPELIANILSATENTQVFRNHNFSNTESEAAYTSIPSKIPFGLCFSDGWIFLDKDYTDTQFLHEYYHSIQSWFSSDYIYAEAFANFGSDGNYNDLYAMFTMLGDLGDRELLFNALAHNSMNDYWDYLISLYPGEDQIIQDLKMNVEKTFTYTYKNKFRIARIQESLRREAIEKISHLYAIKYEQPMEQDSLFQVLIKMYSLDRRYHGENNPLLEDGIVYSYQEGEEIFFSKIDFSTRLITNQEKFCKSLLKK